MLSPSYLNEAAEPLVELWSQVECDITADIARRLAKVDYLTESAKWQVYKAREMGMTQEQIASALFGSTKRSKQQVRQMVEEACADALKVDVAQYRKADMDVAALQSSDALRAVIRAGERKTEKLFKNFTRTTAKTAGMAFENGMDMVWMQVQSGAFSLDQALRKIIVDLGKKGITGIAYPSGHVDKLDVAARRAAVTGINQAACEMQMEAAAEMGCDLVEVTSHAGARPSHAQWQGGIYSLSGKSRTYKPFRQATGYGTGEGLGGWNCRHNFFPFLPGVSGPTFDKDPNRLLGKSNDQVYEESQRQRELERRVRESRRTCATLDAAAQAEPDEKLRSALKDDFESEAMLLKRRERALKDFCKDTGRHVERDRAAVSGYNRSVSVKAGAAAKRQEAISAAKAEVNLLTGKNHIVHIPPGAIDAATLTFDHHHVNNERGRSITMTDAQGFVRDAKLSVRVWGAYERYFSTSGAAYVDIESKMIRTAFTVDEYTERNKEMMEVIKKYGL